MTSECKDLCAKSPIFHVELFNAHRRGMAKGETDDCAADNRMDAKGVEEVEPFQLAATIPIVSGRAQRCRGRLEWHPWGGAFRCRFFVRGKTKGGARLW